MLKAEEKLRQTPIPALDTVGILLGHNKWGRTMMETLGKDALLKVNCWEDADHIPNDPQMTAFKRRARLKQSQWREAMGLETGTQPIRPKPGNRVRDLGSRIPYAQDSTANFLNEQVIAAVKARLANRQPREMINQFRLFADLLSSQPMCFNLFGPLTERDPNGELSLASRAVRRWWPHVPGKVTQVMFEWSPGRGDPRYLNNGSAFDVAFELQLPDGSKGVFGVETKYHEHPAREKKPITKSAAQRYEERLLHYRSVAQRSGVFVPDAADRIIGTEMQQIWQDHLLALSMRPEWSWTGFALVHPPAT